jgi:hypothetical protein
MSEETNKKTPLPLWRRIVFVLIVLVIAGLAAIMISDYIVGKCLDNRIVAINKAGYPISFEQLSASRDATSPNEASWLYTSAISNVSTGDPAEFAKVISIYRKAVATASTSKLPPEFQQLIKNILKQSGSSIVALDKAAAQPAPEFDIGIQHGREICAKTLGQAHKALSLLSLRTASLVASKDYDGAAKSIIAMLKATRVFDTYPTIVVSSTRQYFIQLACDDIRILLIQGNPSDSKLDELANALTEAFESGTIKDTLLAEQVYQIEVSRNLISEKAAENLLQKNISEMPERAKLPETSLREIRLRLFVLRYFNAMANLIEVSSKPTPKLLEYVSNQKEDISDKLKRAYASTHTFIESSVATSAATRSTILMLYMERYRLENDEIPDSLEDIAASIDPAIMIDPYTSDSMLYKKNEKFYTIYSTGPDLTDNGGSINAQLSQETGKAQLMPEDIGLMMLLLKK